MGTGMKRLSARVPGSEYLLLSRTWGYSLIFVLPLILSYQTLIMVTSASGGIRPVNGAEAVLASILGFIGVESYAGFFYVVIGVAVVGTVYDVFYNDRRVKPSYFGGMLLESLVYAIFFGYAVSVVTGAVLPPELVPSDVSAAISGIESASALDKILMSVGAGIYEEIVFRVILISGVGRLVGLGDSPGFGGYILLIGISSIVFSAAHVTGDPSALSPYVFTFRAVGGAVFALVYLVRGFGVVVYTHAFYDILVFFVG